MESSYEAVQVEFWKQFKAKLEASTHWKDHKIDREPAATTVFSFSAKIKSSPKRDRYTQYHARITQKEMSVKINIPYKDADTNTRVWEYLYEHRDEIESEFGDKLYWREADGRIQRQIVFPFNSKVGILGEARGPEYEVSILNKAEWPEYTAWLIENLTNFKRAFESYLPAAHKAADLGEV